MQHSRVQDRSFRRISYYRCRGWFAVAHHHRPVAEDPARAANVRAYPARHSVQA